MEQHTISVLVENKFGALARIAGLFCGRGYNIESLTVNHTHTPGISKMTIVTTGEPAVIEQIDKQLNKLIDVLKVTDLSGNDFIERELLLIKIKVSKDTRSEIVQLTEIFGGKIVVVHPNEIGIELSGESAEIENFISMMKDFEIIEIARTGRVAFTKTPGTSEDLSKI